MSEQTHGELVEGLADAFMESARDISKPRDQRLRAAETAANLGPHTLDELTAFLLALEEDDQEEGRGRLVKSGN